MNIPLFAPAGPYSAMVACQVCGRRGYPGGSWQNPCKRGHAPCPDCGRPLTLRLNGTVRVHTRCLKRRRA